MRIYRDGMKAGKPEPYFDNVHLTLKEEGELIRCYKEATILHQDKLNKYHIDWLLRYNKRIFDEDSNLSRGIYNTLVGIYRELGIELRTFQTNMRGEELGSWYAIPSSKKYPERHHTQVTRRKEYRSEKLNEYDDICRKVLTGEIKKVEEKKKMSETLLGDLRKVADISGIRNNRMAKAIVEQQKEIEQLKDNQSKQAMLITELHAAVFGHRKVG